MHPFYETQPETFRIYISRQLSFPEHLHDHTEFLYVCEGQTQISVESETYRLQCGDCIIIFPGQIHSYRSEAFNRLRILIFAPSLAGSLAQTLQTAVPASPFLKKSEVPSDALLSLERLADPDSRQNAPLCSAWLQVLVSSLMPKLALRKKESSANEPLVYQLIQYMAEHFREPLSLDSLARALHVNKYYLSHIFSEKLHISFPDYLNHLRAEYAAQMMLQSQSTLSQVWESAGFSSQRSFNRAFRSIHGISPLQWKKKQTLLSPEQDG